MRQLRRLKTALTPGNRRRRATPSSSPRTTTSIRDRSPFLNPLPAEVSRESQDPPASNSEMNPPFTFSLVVPNNTELTEAFSSHATQIPQGHFSCGRSDERSKAVVICALGKIILETMGEVINYDTPMTDAVNATIERYFDFTVQRDVFTFSVGRDPAQHMTLSFTAATTTLLRCEPADRVLFCRLPNPFVEDLQILAASFLRERPSDNAVERARPFLPSLTRTHFNIFLKNISKIDNESQFSDALVWNRGIPSSTHFDVNGNFRPVEPRVKDDPATRKSDIPLTPDRPTIAEIPETATTPPTSNISRNTSDISATEPSVEETKTPDPDFVDNNPNPTSGPDLVSTSARDSVTPVRHDM